MSADAKSSNPAHALKSFSGFPAQKSICAREELRRISHIKDGGVGCNFSTSFPGSSPSRPQERTLGRRLGVRGQKAGLVSLIGSDELLLLECFPSKGQVSLRGGSVVEWFRALDLKSGDPWFKSSTLLLSGFVLGSPEFNSSTALCK